MFKKTNVPILGCILNMSSYVCSSCGSETKYKSNIHRLTDNLGIDLLGEIPMDMEISETSDDGYPIVLNSSKNEQASQLFF